MKTSTWGAVVLVLGLVGISAGVEGVSNTVGAAAPVTLTVGLTQDLDSPNVTTGVLVSSFELWNLQYATLTDKAAADFTTIPGLATKWVASDNGLTYTYTLRDGLKWSDGQPLTADDVAWTINTSRDQAWINHSSVTQHLTATAVDATTVKITSSVPDPKLPTMDVYILPRHIWEAKSKDDITKYDALDGVGSGPFTLKEWKPNQEWTMVVNPSYYGGKPKLDQVVFRIYTEGAAMVAALQSGEIDVAHDVPAELFGQLQGKAGIQTVVGSQGGFTEFAMNAGQSGLGDGHPALKDITVRHALAKAIDRKAIFDRVLLGQGTLDDTIGVSPNPEWTPKIPADQQLNYDPAAAKKLLDDAGYKDTNGDGIREMPGGGKPLVFRYAERTESSIAASVRDLITGYLKAIGIGTDVSKYDDTQLTALIGSGKYDLFVWGWTPFVDPDPQLSYFTCDQITKDAASPGSNDSNWCDPAYDKLYTQQNQELDHAKRVDLVHQMITMFYEKSSYLVLFHDADTQAYRTDRFTGWTKQPKDTGPVVFTNTSPTYVNLKPVGAGGGSGGTSTGLIIGLVVGGLVVLLIAGGIVLRSRSRRDDRE